MGPKTGSLRSDRALGPCAARPRVLEHCPQALHRAPGPAHRPGDPGAGRAAFAFSRTIRLTWDAPGLDAARTREFP